MGRSDGRKERSLVGKAADHGMYAVPSVLKLPKGGTWSHRSTPRVHRYIGRLMKRP